MSTICEICGCEPFWQEWAPERFPMTTLVTGKFSWQGISGATRQLVLCSFCLQDTEKLIALHEEIHGTGCCLHILTDDGNVSDHDAAFCVKWAHDHEHTFCEEVAKRIAQMPEAERKARWGCSCDDYNEEEES